LLDGDEGLTTAITGKIEFRNVYFKYPTRSEWVLKDISFKVESSQNIALVGASGSGKSTIILLLERFYEIQSGEILIDDIDIQKYNVTHLRKSMSYVSQEPILFDSTIEENIKYGKQEATRGEVENAAKIASALPFIEKDIEK
jgi:ABC-type multidrug transport system fused ATPase/permease subunit